MSVAVDETEIAGVVIVVAGVMVENHPAELLVHGCRRLCEVACELQERCSWKAYPRCVHGTSHAHIAHPLS